MIGSIPGYDDWKEKIPEIKDPEFDENEAVCSFIDSLEETKKQAELLSEHNPEMFNSLTGIIAGQLKWLSPRKHKATLGVYNRGLTEYCCYKFSDGQIFASFFHKNKNGAAKLMYGYLKMQGVIG